MDYLAKAARVIDLEISELQRLRQRLGESFIRAVDLIKTTVEARGKVIVLGVGKSGHIGEKIAATLTSTGSPAVVLNSLNALHGDLGVVAEGDVVLALSYSGETEELLRILPAIARFQVGVIAMCGDAKSTLGQNCDVFLDVNVEQEACPLNLAPTSSTTVMLVLGDALAMVLLEARGFQKEDFAKVSSRRNGQPFPARAGSPDHATAHRCRPRQAGSKHPGSSRNNDFAARRRGRGGG